MFQINRRSVGLDDLVGGKTWPRVPSEFANQIVGVFDTTPGFMFSRRRGAFQGQSYTLVGLQSAAFGVPADEAWYIDNITVSGACIAGATVQCQVGVSQVGVIPGSGVAVLSFGPWGNSANVLNAPFTASWDAKLWIGPGSGIVVNVTGSGFGAGQGANVYWSGSSIKV